jgi:hypothetical protein
MIIQVAAGFPGSIRWVLSGQSQGSAKWIAQLTGGVP